MTLLVLGIGQSMRGDDAAGLQAVRLWQQTFPESASRARVELCELPGLELLELLEGVQAAVLVDALQTQAHPPGSVVRLAQEELAAFSAQAGSVHGWGVAETLQLGRSLYPWLEQVQVTLIGIAALQYDPGSALSPAVQAALPLAAREIESVVQRSKLSPDTRRNP